MYKGDVALGFVWLVITVAGYVFFVVPGLVLHVVGIAIAASGDPTAPPDEPRAEPEVADQTASPPRPMKQVSPSELAVAKRKWRAALTIGVMAIVAVAALVEDGHVGETYELTGPRLLTFAEAVGELAEASGRPLRYVPASGAQYAEMLSPHLPPDVVRFFVDLFGWLLDGHNAHVSDGFERALGRKPRDFSEYAQDAVRAGAFRQ